MRAIDKDRFLAMHVIKMCAKSILDEAAEYQKIYHGEGSVQEIMDSLDRVWGLLAGNVATLSVAVEAEDK